MRGEAPGLLDRPRRGFLRGQCGQARLDAKHEIPAAIEIRGHQFRAGATARPVRVEEHPDRRLQVHSLAPDAKVMRRRRTARRADQAAHPVPPEADVRGIVDVGFGLAGVNVFAQGRARLFPATAWPPSTISLLTSTRSVEFRRLTLSTSVWYLERCLSQTSAWPGTVAASCAG